MGKIKIRISKLPFWTVFWISVPIHVLILIVPVASLIQLLCQTTTYDYVKINIWGGLVYFALTVLLFMVLYIIWVNKNSYFLILNKSEGSVVKNNNVIYKFRLGRMIIQPLYPDRIELISGLHYLFGKTKKYLFFDNDKEVVYELGIMRHTYKKLEKFLKKYK